ncbi:hypothetical protein CDIK_0424 [Cucumispora dikerogammari]|nr:hypothetical protein CDIK_0424 [Cucumispora dikerogammari]
MMPMKNYTRVAYGLSISLIFSIFQCMQAKIQQGVRRWVIFQDIYRLFFISLFSIVLLFVNPTHEKKEYSKILLLLAPFSDYLGILFINKGFQVAPPFFVFFLNSLIFPMNAIYCYFYDKKTPILTLILFCVLVALVFFNGYYFSAPSVFNDYLSGAMLVFLSNTCFLINIHSQYIVCDAIGMPGYYLRTVPVTFLLGFGISILFDWKGKSSKKQILKFYKKNLLFLILCGISGAIFYMTGSYFITRFSELYFNIAILPSSSISGIISLIFFSEFRENVSKLIKQSIIYVAVIIIGSVMLWY